MPEQNDHSDRGESTPGSSRPKPAWRGAARPVALSRRDLVHRLGAAGFAATVPWGLAAPGGTTVAHASDATPAASPAGTPEFPPAPIDRATYRAALQSAFGLEPAGNLGGQLIYVQTNDLATLNPTLVNDIYSAVIVGTLYESLVTTSVLDGTPVPALADSWDIADDGVTYTFHLNPNASWHDGTPLTATDVIFTIEAVLDETSLSPRRSTLLSILAEWCIIDDHTVELVARDRLATFVADVGSQFGILPHHIWTDVPPAEWGADGGTTGQDPSRVVGSGPFRFREWELGDHATVVRNDTYWDADGIPAVDEFSYRLIPDSLAAVQALRVGEVDIADVPFAEVGDLRADEGLVLAEYDTFDFTYYHFNQAGELAGILGDTAVRQALLQAVDRDLIAEVIYQDLATAAIGTQPTLSIAWDPDRIRNRFAWDLDQARDILREAGFRDEDGDGIVERDGQKLSFEMIYAESTLVYNQLIPYLQQAWQEIGVEMIPVRASFSAVIDAMISGSYDAAIALLSWDTTGNQGVLFRCDAVPPSGFNTMRYCNEAYDALDDQQVRELDPVERRDMLIQLANIVNDDQAISVLVFNKSVQANLPRVHNFRPVGYNPWWSLPLTWVETP